MLQNCSITAGCNSNNSLLHTTFCLLQPAVTWATGCRIQYFVIEQYVGSKPMAWYIYLQCFVHWLNKPSEEVMLHLLYSSCIPVLTYACAVKEYPSRQMQDCCTAMNDALRFLFGYNRWESVRTLRQSFGYKSLVEIFHRAKSKFDTSLYSHRNPVIRHIRTNMPCEQEE